MILNFAGFEINYYYYTKLLAKLSEGDMVAREACYHLRCMTKFTNTYRSFVKKNVDPDQQKQKKYESIALAEVMNFVEEGLQVNSGEASPFLKLSEIRQYYCGCLTRMNAPSTTANATRLKEKLLKLNSSLQTSVHYKDDLAAALQFSKENFESNASHMTRRAKLIHNEILSTHQTFDGHFKKDCQVDSVSPILLSFLDMVMGNSFERNCISNIPALSIAQLIHFNTARKRSSSDQIRHTASAETPLPIYVALLIHAHTCSRYLIDKLYELGLSISYSRMLTIFFICVIFFICAFYFFLFAHFILFLFENFICVLPYYI